MFGLHLNCTHMNQSPSIPRVVGWIALATLLIASSSLFGQATKPSSSGSASRRLIITQDAAGRELRRDTVAIDPREEAVRELTAASRSLAERARAQAEGLRGNAERLRRKADSLQANGDELSLQAERDLEFAHREIARTLREAERAMRDAERAASPSQNWVYDIERAVDRSYQDIDHSLRMTIPRPPRPPRSLRGQLGETYGPTRRIIIQGDAEVDVDEKDLSNDSVEVKQYTTRRKKGSGSSSRSYSYVMPAYPTPPMPPTRPIATIDVSSDNKKATVYFNLQGGEHTIRLTDANKKELFSSKISGRGRFERVVDLPSGTKKPLRLEVTRKDQGNDWNYVITED